MRPVEAKCVLKRFAETPRVRLERIGSPLRVIVRNHRSQEKSRLKIVSAASHLGRGSCHNSLQTSIYI